MSPKGSKYRDRTRELFARSMVTPNRARRAEGLPERCRVCHNPVKIMVFKDSGVCSAMCEKAET